MRALQQGDAGVYAELSGRFGPPLHRFATSRLAGDRDLAEEIVVETLVVAVKNIRRFSPRKSSLSAWLHGIARHRVLKELRNQRRSKSVPASAQVPLEAAADIASGDDIADTVTQRLESGGLVARLAAVLSEAEMDVLLLRCLGELSTREISRVVGRSNRAVETLLHRAKQKAREGLESDVE